MAYRRFVELWTHRYRKYSHLFKAHFSGWVAVLSFWLRRVSLGKGRELIAVIRTEHFGDIVAAEPVSRHLRHEYPDAFIVWFVKPAFRELVDVNPNIDQTFAEFCVTQRKVILSRGVFDRVFELQFRNNSHCAKCQLYLDNPIADSKTINVHTYFNFGNLLEVFAASAGIATPLSVEEQPVLYLQEAHRNKADSLNLPEQFIVIHTQTNYTPKDWPAKNWETLLTCLMETYPLDVVEIGLKSNLNIKGERYHDLCGKLSILETAEVIRRGQYFIGLDSGPAHLANASGVYGFILMGSLGAFPEYNPFSGRYAHKGNCTLIRAYGKPCVSLPAEVVIQVITEKITLDFAAKV